MHVQIFHLFHFFHLFIFALIHAVLSISQERKQFGWGIYSKQPSINSESSSVIRIRYFFSYLLACLMFIHFLSELYLIHFYGELCM